MQIALGDLGEMSDPYLVRQALRGVDTVVHLAATIRDQPPHRIEELNGLATVRLLRAAERSGVQRFVFFSALNASAAQRTRFFRAKWLAEQAVASSPLETTIFAPSIVYDHSDPWMTLLRRFSFLPVLPVSGDGQARFEPIWAEDAARCVVAALERRASGERYELAGPETLSYDEMSDLVSRVAGRPRAARPPAPAADPRRPDRDPLPFRRGRVCNLGGGGADGGSDGQRARHGRRRGARSRAEEDGRCPGGVLRRAAALALAVVAIAGAGQASALTLVPPKPSVLFGVSDRGTTQEFNEFTELLAKHPALLQTFHPWGNSLNQAYERWRETGTRPILAISTADDQTLAELITPEQIALGAGDDYLLQLNDFFAKRGLPAYIRPLGEPNRCLNAWSAVNCDGSQKGGEHTTGWYKQAFRRIVAIVRGGQTLEGINATLAEIGLPPLNRTKGPNPTALPAAPVSIIWSPLPGGSPRVKGNFPGNYWPGEPLGRLGRHRLLLRVSGLERPQPLLRRQAVEGQADRDHRVGGLRQRRTALRQSS